MNRLLGKVAIVTGAAGGLGAAQVACFVREGAMVIATDLRPSGIAKLDTAEDRLHFRLQDVTSESAWRELVEWIMARFGRLDVLVNNAGYFKAGTIEETTAELMDVHYRINALGPFLGMAAVIPAMKARGAGSIINISSLAGLRGLPGQFAYCASKWAARGMTKCAAKDLGPSGIRVNSIHPGLIETPILKGLSAEDLASAKSIIPTGDMGHPNDIAEAVAFLASDAAGYISGAELSIDGGAAA